MSQIQDLPVAKDYGLGFNYSVWTAGTVATFCNVPWNSDYRDIVRFDNQTALNAYLDNQTGPKLSITKMSYAKFGQPIKIDQPFNAVQKYNYLRASNPLQPITGDVQKDYYYFIVGIEYSAPNTTYVYLQLDVWQTFGYNVQFGNCYIERGHIGIANENGFDLYGREYLTEPEGLDIGGEYLIVDQWKRTLATTRNVDIDNNPLNILVLSTVDLEADPGTVEAPKLTSATGSDMENLPNGANIYLFQSLKQFRAFLEKRKEQTWVLQGILSITAVPSDAYSLNGEPITETVDGVVTIVGYKVSGGSMNTVAQDMKTNWRGSLDDILGTRYRHLKKFLTSPYCMLEMTSYNGTPLIIKPESWNNANGRVVEVPHFAPPSPRLMFYPYRYNAHTLSGVEGDASGVLNDGGEFLDFATGIFNFPTFSIVNNGYIQFMAANTHGIAFQNQSADWSQNRALQGNQTSYDQASAGIGLSREMNQLGVNAATQSTGLANDTAAFQAMHSTLGGFSGGLKGGGVPGAIVGGIAGGANAGIGLAIGNNQRNQSLGIQTNLANKSTAAQTGNAEYVRDSNKSYADWATKGDYSNAIAGINAKIQDARLTQPTTAGQVGGDAFTLAMYKWGYDVKVKMVDPAAMARYGEFWLRYGYAVNRFGRMPVDFMCMSKATYWKLKETYIVSAGIPETFKQTIRGIFEKGVTVWKDPEEIGNIDFADNVPMTGIAL